LDRRARNQFCQLVFLSALPMVRPLGTINCRHQTVFGTRDVKLGQ